jgi:hypothetical protein
MIRVAACLTLLLAFPAGAQPVWYVLSHDDGCIEPGLLMKSRALALSRAPASPEDFAQMMRERGKAPAVGLPAGFPADLAGKVVQVSVGDSMAPIFATAEVCRNVSKGMR